ncbi:T9SS type A sorting domain-containing protein [Thermoflexibacter ruber]|uniref:Delta-60 repeat domain-containing protein/Por secretion system C-terminal sorting domain-containing protein n=1 Tax=Thermoflexibacter ruber TaxID=1003 RepID=A0A1I2K225_9BACT|nr:T9SS type A sorting domain-containing protein [Thermoflexibacter ruber]SFF61225.1 delta-60 repeat domain-containing protein/Por secretion system C-terminal sorting domain-containing protein [Thermoflexibacter ruber]
MKKYVLHFPCQKVFWQGFRIVVLAFLVGVLPIAQGQAQNPTWIDDPTFTVTAGQGQVGVSTSTTPSEQRPLVGKVFMLPDEKILVGGSFNSFSNGVAIGRIARLNSNGINDATFNAGGVGFTTGTNFVNDIVRQSDGKIIAIGNLFTYNNIGNINNVIRVSTDGIRDQTFAAPVLNGGNTTEINAVYALALQTVGNETKVIVGGGFRRDATQTETVIGRIVRLNANGTRDNTFVTGTGFATGNSVFNNAYVYALAIQVDGVNEKIIVGGDFTSYNNTVARKIVRLNTNGSLDATFNVGTAFADTDKVYVIKLQTSGKILIGGSFTTFNGTSANHIIRLNADGTRDNSFNIGTGFNNPVRDIQLQGDQIWVGGDFTAFNGSPINRLIRLNNDGTRDNTFSMGTGFDGRVRTIAVQSDGKIIVGGDFATFNGVVKNGIVRLASLPVITTTGTLTPFSTCAGTPSASQTYTVSGSNLSANITINAPTGFEISSNGTTFSNTLTLNATNGTVANTTITVRLAANASGSPSGNITHTSGTATQNVAVSGAVNPIPTITLGTVPSVTTTATSVGIPYTAVTGSPNQYSITAGANALAGFVPVNNQALTASPISLSLPATKNAGTYNFNLTVRNSTTGCISAVVPFSVVVGATASAFTITFSNTLTPFNSCAGSASNVQTYTLSVTNMTEELAVTPPAGFQISDDGVDYFTRITFTPPPSGAGSATIRVRLAANATGSPSGNITHTNGTVTQNVAVSGTVNPIPTITLGAIPSINTRSTSFTIPYTATTGSPNQFSLTAGANALPGFVPINKQPLTASPITVNIPQNTVAGNYNFNLVVHNSVTGCESAVIPFTLNNVMSAVDEEFSNSILAYPNPTSNRLIVQFPKNAKIEVIKLLNSLGQEVKSLSKQEIQEQLQLDLSEYASGVYYLHVIEQKRVAVKRINLSK